MSMSQVGFEETLNAVSRSGTDNNKNKSGVPTMGALQHLCAAVETQQQWNRQTATKLVQFVQDLLSASPNDDMTVKALQLANTVFERWPDDLVRMVSCSGTNKSRCLMDSIYSIMVNESKSVILRYAVLVVSRWWQLQERIHWYTALDVSNKQASKTVWVDGRERLEQIALIAMNIFLSEAGHTPSQVSFGSHDEVRIASILFLSNLLKHGISGWLNRSPLVEASNNDTVPELCKSLSDEISRLNDGHLAASSARLVLACLALQCLIQKRHHEPIPDLDALLSSTPIVENVIKVAFPTEMATPRGPRWTYESCHDVREYARAVIQAWSLVGEGEAWSSFWRLKHMWQTFAAEAWSGIVTGKHSPEKLQEFLQSLLLLHRVVDKTTSHEMLTSVIAGLDNRKSPHRQLLTSLSSLSLQDNFTISLSSLALFKILLSDRPGSYIRDELCRELWEAAIQEDESNFVPEKMLDQMVKLHDNDRYGSRLLCVCNIMHHLVASKELCRQMLSQPSLHKMMQSLLHIIKRTTKVSDQPQVPSQHQASGFLVNEEDTPKMANLETANKSFFTGCMNQLTDTTELDVAIRVSTATVLARLGWFSIDPPNTMDDRKEDRLSGLQGSIRSSVSEFVLDLPSPIHRPGASHDLTRRLLGLTSFLACSCEGMEEVVASVLYATEVNHAMRSQQQEAELTGCRQALKETTKNLNNTKKERDNYIAELTSQRLIHERDTNRIRLQASNNAARLVEVHAMERAKAQEHASECTRRMEVAEAKQREAENAVEACRASQDLIRSKLSEATDKIKDLERELEVQRSQLQESQERNHHLARELQDKKEECNDAKETLLVKEQELKGASVAVSKAQSASNELHSDLEQTYLNLVALVNVYEDKEQEMVAMKQEHGNVLTKTKKKLQAEQNRYEILEDSENRLQRENERLLKKLARAKEKLEEERRDRREEAERKKRYGPVSYINQLHDESMAVSEKQSSSSRRKNRTDKENYSEHSPYSSRRNRFY